MTQNHVIVFFTLIVFSGGELPVDNKCEFYSFLWVRASLVESQQMSSFVFISSHVPFFCIHVLSCCIDFLSCSFHFAFMSFHVALISFHFAFMSFHVPSLWRKDTGLRKLICSNQSGQSGGYPPKRSCFFNISLLFLLSFSYRFGGLCRLPSSGFMIMYMYKLVIVFFYSFRFLGRQCIGSVKVQAKLK